MNRSCVLTGAVLVASACLQGQAPVVPLPQTVIHDIAWSSSATALNLSRARSLTGRARLSNVSIRAKAGNGADALIAGAAVQGSGNLPMFVRAIGPGLAQFGVTGFLRTPRLEIYRGDVLAALTNTTGPGVAAASNYLGTFPPLEASAGSTAGDAALVGQAAAGTLTASCSSASGTAGVALLEFYDAAAAPAETAARFVNLSARARVETGENVMVVGFVVAGEGYVTLLLRGVGPTLERLGVPGFLRDPTIELFAGNVRIAGNDSWSNGTQDESGQIEAARRAVGAFGLTSSGDAALLVTLPAGSYTLQVRDVGDPEGSVRVPGLPVVRPGSTPPGAVVQGGIALAEIYEVARLDFDAAQATNAVGLELFREFARSQPEGNLALSPYSIESALALVYAGSAGGTREEMIRALRLPADNAPLQAGFAGLRRALEATVANSRSVAEARARSGQPTDPIEWSAANRLFGQQGYAFRDSFVTLMRDGFAAPFEVLDFVTNAELGRIRINTWVGDQTRQRITDLLPPGALDEFTRLVLVNAFYLKVPWSTPFEASATTRRPFHLATGGSRDVPTMSQTRSLGYAAEDGFTFVTLPYLGDELQFVIALPNVGQTIEAAAARLTSGHFLRWAGLAGANPRTVDLFLPRFTMPRATLRLGAALRALGVNSAFDVPPGSANFEGIAPRLPDHHLAISEMFHQTFVALDEAGTEAAAATGVVTPIDVSISIGSIEVRVDRPFLFAIQHRASGVCLFFGRVMDPQ